MDTLVSRPYIVLTRAKIVNDNNRNGRLDPGERAGITAFLSNLGNRPATNVLGTLRTSSPFITITDSSFSFGSINARDSVSNQLDPFDVVASAAAPPGTPAGFTLMLVAAETTCTLDFSCQIGLLPGTLIWGSKPLPGFPGDGFAQGLAYDPVSDQILVLDAGGRSIHTYSSDSGLVYRGSIAAPDTCLSDISYSEHDDRLWVTGYSRKSIWKISKADGTILRQFVSPAQEYPTGLAWDGARLWLADRRTDLGATQLIYVSDTLGSATRYNSPIQGYYSSRCLAHDRTGDTYIQTQTWYDSSGNVRDSVGVVEYQGEPPFPTGNRFKLYASWGIRGIEYDPRDGSYWITIPQVASATVNRIAKVSGFHGGVVRNKEAPREIAKRTGFLAICPNPGLCRINIECSVPGVDAVKITIRNIAGRTVKCLDASRARVYPFIWDGTDERGHRVPAGVYFCQLTAADYSIAKKFVLLR